MLVTVDRRTVESAEHATSTQESPFRKRCFVLPLSRFEAWVGRVKAGLDYLNPFRDQDVRTEVQPGEIKCILDLSLFLGQVFQGPSGNGWLFSNLVPSYCGRFILCFSSDL